MKYITGLVCSLAFAGAANAQDFPGLRFEGLLGWDHVGAALDYEDIDFPEDNFKETGSTDGFLVGAAIGYDVPVGPVYLGVEGSIDIPINNRCEEVYGDDAACFKTRSNLAIGGRIGVPASKSALLYVGAAYVSGEAEISYTDDFDPDFDLSYSDRQGGYRLSGGAEVRLTGNWFAKAEYRYSDYDDYSVSEGTETANLSFDRHQVVTGLGVRF